MFQNRDSFDWFFSSSPFFLLTYAEIKAFSVRVSKKKKEPLKRTAEKNHFFRTCKPTIYLHYN